MAKIGKATEALKVLAQASAIGSKVAVTSGGAISFQQPLPETEVILQANKLTKELGKLLSNHPNMQFDHAPKQLKAGQQVKFKAWPEVYSVKAANDRLAVCVWGGMYTVADFENGIKATSACWGHGTKDMETINKMLDELTSGEEWLSDRNRAKLDIEWSVDLG